MITCAAEPDVVGLTGFLSFKTKQKLTAAAETRTPIKEFEAHFKTGRKHSDLQIEVTQADIDQQEVLIKRYTRHLKPSVDLIVTIATIAEKCVSDHSN